MVRGRNPLPMLDLADYYRVERDALIRWEDDGGSSNGE
jgi:hypothetical protein